MKKILMADDDAEDRYILLDAVRNITEHPVLLFAEDGIGAISMLEESFHDNNIPCLIILDLNMPRLSGTETLKKLKTDPRFRDIPVIIYSTSINPLEKAKCLQLGAHDYMAKPVSYTECIQIARMFIDFCA